MGIYTSQKSFSPLTLYLHLKLSESVTVPNVKENVWNNTDWNKVLVCGNIYTNFWIHSTIILVILKIHIFPIILQNAKKIILYSLIKLFSGHLSSKLW